MPTVSFDQISFGHFPGTPRIFNPYNEPQCKRSDIVHFAIGCSLDNQVLEQIDSFNQQTMRFSIFVALVVATFVASCVGFVNAENAVQVDKRVGDSESEVITNDNKVVRRLREGRKLANQWWLSDANNEERRLGNAKSFLSRLGGKLFSKTASGLVGKKETLSKAEINSVARGVVTDVKKTPGNWSKIKKGLKILYGVTITSLILMSAIAMYKLSD